ncbi:hypothetical protein ACFXPA_48815, partial [Amycolatopsis sp. NPDC059090]
MPEGLKTELPEVTLVFHVGGAENHADPHDSWRVLVVRKIDEALIARGPSLRMAGAGLKVGLIAVRDNDLLHGEWVELVVDQRPRERLSRLRAASSAELTVGRGSRVRITQSSLRRVGWCAAGAFAASLLGGGDGSVSRPVTVTLDRTRPMTKGLQASVAAQVRKELWWGAALALAVARERAGRGEPVGGWSAQDLPASAEGLLPEVNVVENRIKHGFETEADLLPVRVQFAKPAQGEPDAGVSAEAVERFFAGTGSRIAVLLGENEDMGEGSSDWWGGPEPGGVGQESVSLLGEAEAVFGSAPVFGNEFEGAFWAEFDSGMGFGGGSGGGPSSGARPPGFVREDWTPEWVDEAADPVGGPAAGLSGEQVGAGVLGPVRLSELRWVPLMAGGVMRGAFLSDEREWQSGEAGRFAADFAANAPFTPGISGGVFVLGAHPFIAAGAAEGSGMVPGEAATVAGLRGALTPEAAAVRRPAASTGAEAAVLLDAADWSRLWREAWAWAEAAGLAGSVRPGVVAAATCWAGEGWPGGVEEGSLLSQLQRSEDAIGDPAVRVVAPSGQVKLGERGWRLDEGQQWHEIDGHGRTIGSGAVYFPGPGEHDEPLSFDQEPGLVLGSRAGGASSSAGRGRGTGGAAGPAAKGKGKGKGKGKAVAGPGEEGESDNGGAGLSSEDSAAGTGSEGAGGGGRKRPSGKHGRPRRVVPRRAEPGGAALVLWAGGASPSAMDESIRKAEGFADAIRTAAAKARESYEEGREPAPVRGVFRGSKNSLSNSIVDDWGVALERWIDEELAGVGAGLAVADLLLAVDLVTERDDEEFGKGVPAQLRLELGAGPRPLVAELR